MRVLLTKLALVELGILDPWIAENLRPWLDFVQLAPSGLFVDKIKVVRKLCQCHFACEFGQRHVYCVMVLLPCA